jgi:hypothetical protein
MFARAGLLIVEPLNSFLLSLDEILKLLLVHLVNSFRHNATMVPLTESKLFKMRHYQIAHRSRASAWQGMEDLTGALRPASPASRRFVTTPLWGKGKLHLTPAIPA